MKEKLDRIFSLYIRLRDSQIYNFEHFKCISCGQIKPFDQMDCGHLINRRHMSLRFNEQNCNGQCRQCNRFDEGNIIGYIRGFEQKYGKDKLQLLENEKLKPRKYTKAEYELLIKHYKQKVDELRKGI